MMEGGGGGGGMREVVVRRGSVDDLAAIVGLTKALAYETESGLQLETELVERGVSCGLQPRGGSSDAGGDGDDGEAGKGPDLRPMYWVAVRGDERVGFIGVSPEWSDWWATSYWWVISFFVDAKWRRRGVATEMFKAMQRDAEASGVQTINLRVEEGNTGAQAFYRKIGFAIDRSHLIMSCGRKPDGQHVGSTAAASPKEK